MMSGPFLAKNVNDSLQIWRNIYYCNDLLPTGEKERC
jgi:hypothetical protein